MADREERTTEPLRIAQGERIIWTRIFDGFPATEYSLQYRIRGNGTGIDVTATADGDAFDAAITAAQSATLSAGERYEWQAWLTEIADATNTWKAASGSLTVDTGFTAGATSAVDRRTPNKIILDAINAAILNKATNDQLEYEITTPAGSRKLKRMPLKDLMDARTVYAKLVRNERAAERVRNGGLAGRAFKARIFEE